MVHGLKQYVIIVVSLFFISGLVLADNSMNLGKQAFNKKEYRTAEIHFKNSLQANPKNKQARSLLGQTYFYGYNFNGAEKELRRALKLDDNLFKARVTLSKTYLFLGERDKAIAELKIKPTYSIAQKAQINAIIGEVHFENSDFKKSQKSYLSALKLDPNNITALTGLSKYYLLNKDYSRMQVYLDKVLEKNPNNATTLAVKGEMFLNQKDFKQAEIFLLKALDAEAYNLTANIAFAKLGIEQGSFKDAGEKIDRILSIIPRHSVANYYRAIIDFSLKQYDAALKAIDIVIEQQSGFIPAWFMKGNLLSIKNNSNQAIFVFRKILNIDRLHVGARKAIATIYLSFNDADNALKTLRPIESIATSSTPKDHQVLTLMGNAYLIKKDNFNASRYLKLALSAKPGDKKSKIQYAIALMNSETDQEASKYLETLDTDNIPVAQMLLIMSYLSNKLFDKAIDEAISLSKTSTHSPIPYNLLGNAYLGQGNFKKAKDAFKKSIRKDPRYITGYLNLANLALKENNLSYAEENFKKTLSISENNMWAISGLANISEARGNIKKATQYWEKAILKNPEEDPDIYLSFINFCLANDLFRKAERVLSIFSRNFPNHLAINLISGKIKYANGDLIKAKYFFERYLKSSNENLDSLFLMAETNKNIGATKESIKYYEKIIGKDKSNLTALVNLVKLNISQKKLNEARKYNEYLYSFDETKIIAIRYEADMLIKEKKYKKAIISYQKIASKLNEFGIYVNLYYSYLTTGEEDKGLNQIYKWLDSHPNDINAKVFLATELQRIKRTEESEIVFETVLKQDSENVIALNNLAWIYLEQNRIQKAIKMSEIAYNSHPGEIQVIDTMGQIYLKAGMGNKAIRIYAKGVKDNPRNYALRYSFAEALYQSGKIAEAKRETENIIIYGTDDLYAKKVTTLNNKIKDHM